MNTPIYDFVKSYRNLRPVRLHMPGHKGRGSLGCEELDLTELPGADSLYEAHGIIAESEANASALFGCPTFYSTEGSSHCIRAMLLLAMQHARMHGKPARVLAARNVHRSFLTAVALLDPEVVWLHTPEVSYLSADLTPAALDAALFASGAPAVYLTCPDYLGKLPDLRPLSEICRAHGALLLVDNAHGAYLRFLPESRHPMDLGADLCCDSAHKTLPVLTGGAYLHLAPHLGRELVQSAKNALSLFGSTSPSYLILQSLDLANPYLQTLPKRLSAMLPLLAAIKVRLEAEGWSLMGDEPLKLTLCPRSMGLTGTALAEFLNRQGIVCEFADRDYVVLMISPQNGQTDLDRLTHALRQVDTPKQAPAPEQPASSRPSRQIETVCSIRQAMLAPAVTMKASDSLGQVLAQPGVSCPPAVPILMPGERIDEAAVLAFANACIQTVQVLV